MGGDRLSGEKRGVLGGEFPGFQHDRVQVCLEDQEAVFPAVLDSGSNRVLDQDVEPQQSVRDNLQ